MIKTLVYIKIDEYIDEDRGVAEKQCTCIRHNGISFVTTKINLIY